MPNNHKCYGCWLEGNEKLCGDDDGGPVRIVCGLVGWACNNHYIPPERTTTIINDYGCKINIQKGK